MLAAAAGTSGGPRRTCGPAARKLAHALPGLAAPHSAARLLLLPPTLNPQYRYGTTTGEALRTLWKDGGVVRFYRGLGPALLQGPLSRFGDTAANTGD